MQTIEERQGAFWARVTKTDTCWQFAPVRERDGYGQFSVAGRNRCAHCWAWEWENGPIPEGMEIDHICRVRACVRPSHLRLLTITANRRNQIARSSKLTACPRGHPYSGLNNKGKRICRICQNNTTRLFEAAKRQRAREARQGI